MIVVAVLFVWCVLATVAIAAYNLAKHEVHRRYISPEQPTKGTP